MGCTFASSQEGGLQTFNRCCLYGTSEFSCSMRSSLVTMYPSSRLGHLIVLAGMSRFLQACMRNDGDYPISQSRCATTSSENPIVPVFSRTRLGQPRDGIIWILVEARCIRRSHVGKIKVVQPMASRYLNNNGCGRKAGVASMSVEVAVRLQTRSACDSGGM